MERITTSSTDPPYRIQRVELCLRSLPLAVARKFDVSEVGDAFADENAPGALVGVIHPGAHDDFPCGRKRGKENYLVPQVVRRSSEIGFTPDTIRLFNISTAPVHITCISPDFSGAA